MAKNKLRSVNTKFWQDPFVQELNSSHKLLFLYLLTNSHANLIGIYEISIKTIVFDTKLDEKTILKGFESFREVGKAFYENNYVILPNFLKNQNLNTNMKKAVISEFEDLPNFIKDKALMNGKEGLGNGSEGFETIKEWFEKVKGNMKEEREVETENEKRKYKSFITLFNKISGREFKNLDTKAKKQLNARIKQGYTSKDFEKAITNLYNDEYHRENGYTHATPEFITREDKLVKFLNVTDKSAPKRADFIIKKS